MTLANASVLVLNADFRPLRTSPVRRALSLLNKGRADLISVNGNACVRSVTMEIPVPSVIRLKEYHNVPYGAKWSKRGVYERDGFVCQYCGKHLTLKEATIDHIIPKSVVGGKIEASTWTNTVTACRPCNLRKGNRPLHETGMRLKQEPKAPRARILSVVGNAGMPDEWRQYYRVG